MSDVYEVDFVSESDDIYQIYDRIFKRIFSLSNLAIINLINGLFGINHPPNSEVTYKNREFVKKNLSSVFADLFIVINNNTYHLEAQMTKDKSIVIRVFEYCFDRALEDRQDDMILKFPEPIVIYLDDFKDIPKKTYI